MLYSGHVRVYEYVANEWSQLGSDIDGEAANDQSGYSVSLSDDGTTVAIGAPGNDDNGNNSGHVRVYEYDESTANEWTQLGQDIDGEAGSDQSGYSVSLSGDGTRLAIGARNNDANGLINSGHVRVYEYDESTANKWSQLGSDIDGEAANDKLGYSVSLSGDGTKVAIGAPYNAANGSNSGHVQIFTFEEASESPSVEPSESPSFAPKTKSNKRPKATKKGRVRRTRAPKRKGKVKRHLFA